MDLSLFLDQDMLNTLLSLDDFKGVFLDELIDIYVTTTPQVLQRLIHAIEAGKELESIRLAHKLKGMCGTLGILKLVAILEHIEVSFATTPEPDRKKLPGELLREYHLSISLLNTHWHSQKKQTA